MIVRLSPREVTPDRNAVLDQLGVSPGAEVPPHIQALLEAAARRLEETVSPVGIVESISTDEFEKVYYGEGLNERPSVVADIFPRAEHLALFAVTLGPETSRAIAGGFQTRDFALASVLDAAASESADRAAERVERWFETTLHDGGWEPLDGAVLRYSPGYCGWDVTGQRRLFAYLGPERIGLTLTESCLMQPIKSVSGVLLAGPRSIHRFRPSYEFCGRCETKSCRERLRTLFAAQGHPHPERGG